MIDSALSRFRIARPLNANSFRLLIVLNLVVFAAARLTGFGRESVIAGVFGASRETDAYVAAIALPEVMAGVFFGGLIGYTVIPRFVALRREGDERGASALIGAAFNQVLLWCGGAALAGTLLARPLIAIAAPGLEGDARTDAVHILQLTSVTVLLYGLTGLSGAILNSNGRFLPVPASIIAGNLVAIGILAVVQSRIGIAAAGVAYTAAAVVTTAIQWTLLVRVGALGRLHLSLRNPHTRTVLRTGGIAMLAVGIPYFRYIVERGMVSTLSAGDVAALGFATRTLFVAGALIAIPIGTVVFPRMASEANTADLAPLRRTIRRSVLLVSALSIPVALILIAFGHPIVSALFNHGAFTEDATDTTTKILRVYATALVPLCLAEVLLRVAFVIGAELVALISVIVTFALNVLVNLALLNRLGVNAVAVGASVGIWSNVVLLGSWLILKLRNSSRST